MRFLETVVDKCQQHYDDLSKVVFVLPGRRAGTFLKKYILENNPRTQWSPKVISFNELAADHTGLELMDGITLHFELYKIYRTIKKNAEDFIAFDSWASIILNDYNAIDNYLVDAKKVYSDLRNIKDIEEWSFSLDPLSDDQKKFLEFWDILGLLHDKFKVALLDNKMAYSGMLMRTLAENIAEYHQEEDNIEIVFAGFNALSSAEVKIIQYYQKNHDALIFWDIDPYYLQSKDHPAGYFVRRWIKELGSATEITSHSKINDKNKDIELVSVSNPLSQCRVLGEMLDESDRDSNVAIVLADENLLFPLLESLPVSIDKVNITMGLSFVKSALYKLFSSIISIHLYASSRQLSQGTYGYYHKDFVQCIQELMGVSPGLISNADFYKLSTDIRLKNKHHIDDKYLKSKELKGVLKKVSFLFDPVGSRVSSLIDSLLRFIQVLIEDASLDSLNKEIAVQFEKLLIRFEEVNSRYEYIDSVSGFLTIFRQMAVSEKLAFLGEPLGGIQIMGMLETRAIDFDKVFLIGANEGVLPGSRKPNSFFPHELKKYYGLPNYRDHDAVYAYYFYRLIQHPGTVKIVYGLERDDFGGGGEKSRFVRQLAYEHQRNNLDSKLIATAYKSKVDSDTVQNISVVKTDEIIDHLKRLMTGNGLSPSAMIRFVNCPLDYYYRYVLGLKEDDELEDEINNAVMGTCIHDTLENLYMPLLGVKLEKSHLSELKKGVVEELRSQFKKSKLEDAIASGANHLIYLISEQMVHKVIDLDIARVAQGGAITIIGLEQDYTSPLSVLVDNKPIEIMLRGKVDRVEVVDGEIHIVDYKSGRVESKDLLISKDSDLLKKTKALQLSQYMWLFRENNPEENRKINASVFSLVVSKDMEVNLNFDKLFSDDTHKFMASFEQSISIIVNEMLDQAVDFDHKSRAVYCEYCLI